MGKTRIEKKCANCYYGLHRSPYSFAQYGWENANYECVLCEKETFVSGNDLCKDFKERLKVCK